MSHVQEDQAETEAQQVEALCREAQAVHATELARARELVERARGIAERSGDPLALARSLHALGTLHLAQAEYAEAEEVLHHALKRSRSAADHGLSVDVLRSLLKCAFFTQRLDVALTRGMQALHLAEQRGSGEQQAAVHNELGLVYGRLGDFEGSLDHLLAGLRLLRAAGSADDASTLNNIGNVYLELRDDAQALHFFRAALDACPDGAATRLRGIVLGNVGRAHARRGEHWAALDAFRRSVEIFEETDERVYLAPALARLGSGLAAVGDCGVAHTCLERSLTLAEEPAHGAFLDEVLVAAGSFHLERGEAGTAIDLLLRALAQVPADEATLRTQELHRLLAEAYERAGDLAASLRHLKAQQRVSLEVADASSALRMRRLMVEFDVERARQQEEIFRLKNVELANAYEELRTLHAQLEARNHELQRVSIEDALTGVFNRRYLDLQLPAELSRARRRDLSLSVAMCDIDHFKEINDRYSHAVGDEVLRHLGKIFRSVTREEDLVCRYGGEEFVIVMPETDLEGAHGLMERLRASLAAQPWTAIHPELRVTLSVGLAVAAPATDPAELLAQADAHLYWAKRNGRDRVFPGNAQLV